MNNIFENAYFGKVYKTRDGRKAIYKDTFFRKSYETDTLVQFHKLMVDGADEDGNDIIVFMNNGKRGTKCQGIDIISEWEEEPFGNTSNAKLKFGDAKLLIDEEKLDEISYLYVDETSMTGFYFNGYDTYDAWSDDDIANAYKAGYRKAKEE